MDRNKETKGESVMITIKKTVTTSYNFALPYVTPFAKYDERVFKNAERRGINKCFWCNEQFYDGQDVYIGFGKGTKNRLFCKKCYEKGLEQEAES